MAQNDFTRRKLRARDLGIPLEGSPGPWNAVTDVPGVEVGYCTLVSGNGPLVVGSGPVRTGVTAILPRGRASTDPVHAAWFPLNGNGEMTGTAWIEESGLLEGPVLFTNTHSVGVARDALISWCLQRGRLFQPWALPVVAETCDGHLNDMNGFHVRPEHVFAALDGARSGPLAEGNVGGGTGMICYDFKGGTGTASRKLAEPHGAYTLGVLVQANHGWRSQLLVAGVPVGQELPKDVAPVADRDAPEERSSILVLIATDAPMMPHQLKRLAKRASLGLARTGGIASNGSGDLFLAFSTANPGAARPDAGLATVQMLPNDRLTPLFSATIQATEEAILNCLLAAETMTGADGLRVEALPHEPLLEALRRYNRLTEVA